MKLTMTTLILLCIEVWLIYFGWSGSWLSSVVESAFWASAALWLYAAVKSDKFFRIRRLEYDALRNIHASGHWDEFMDDYLTSLDGEGKRPPWFVRWTSWRRRYRGWN